MYVTGTYERKYQDENSQQFMVIMGWPMKSLKGWSTTS